MWSKPSEIHVNGWHTDNLGLYIFEIKIIGHLSEKMGLSLKMYKYKVKGAS